MWTRTLAALTLSATVASGMHTLAAQSRDERTIEDIQNKLLRLPYYGVFDSLAFSYDKGTVTLLGYAAHSTLRRDAERAVKQVARVDDVVNRIEDLPPSSNDDDLRWRTYYAIYNDPFLSRYAPAGGMLWGHQHPVLATPFGLRSRFAGMYPTGNYPIQIIVKRGRITLIGMVDNDSDRTLAEMRARSVAGSFSVENELTIDRQPT
jgi:hyperosmotically inducible protein